MRALFELLRSFFTKLFGAKKAQSTNYRGYERAEKFSPLAPSISVPETPKDVDVIETLASVIETEPTPAPELFDAPKQAAQAAISFRYPVEQVGITSGYLVPAHMGIDFGFFSGRKNAPILSATAGVVVKVWRFSDAGLTVRVRYDDLAAGQSWYAQYKHLSRADVLAGETVAVGQQLGLMGDSGGYAGQYHLHFDLVKCPLGYDYTQSGAAERREYSVNPLKYLTLHDGQFVGTDTQKLYNITDGRLVKK